MIRRGVILLERQNRLDIEVIYYNVSTNSLFITFISFLLTYYAWKSSGWGVLTKLILIISVLLLFVTIALFFQDFQEEIS